MVISCRRLKPFFINLSEIVLSSIDFIACAIEFASSGSINNAAFPACSEKSLEYINGFPRNYASKGGKFVEPK